MMAFHTEDILKAALATSHGLANYTAANQTVVTMALISTIGRPVVCHNCVNRTQVTVVDEAVNYGCDIEYIVFSLSQLKGLTKTRTN